MQTKNLKFKLRYIHSFRLQIAIIHDIRKVKWPGKKLNLRKLSQRISLEQCDNSFSSFPLKLPGTAFHHGIKVTKSCITSHTPLKITELSFPLMQCYKCVQARDRMYEMLDSTISRRRSGQEFQQDFLGSLVMKHRKEDGEGSEG